MSQIVNLTEIINKNKSITDEEAIQQASEVALDVIEEQFEEGILIGVLNSKLQLSTTIEDDYDVIRLLESALENLYMEIKNDKEITE
jgi:broad-specificity NMP kinase